MISTASDMQRLTRVTEMRKFVARARSRGKRVGFVPTMGFLHEGHLRLVDEARRRADVVVMSIFVNPLQFGPTEDLARYPRDLEGDAGKAEARGVDGLFVPEGREIYPEPPRVVVTPRSLAARWEGAARPGHFEGVLTVVAKLFNIVQPHVAVFGQKDIQQVTLVRAMVRDLDMPVEIVVAPTVRERALALSGALRAVQTAHASGERSAARLEEVAIAHLAERGIEDVEYVAVADPETLEPLVQADAGAIVALAARVGRTRLIDNIILGTA